MSRPKLVIIDGHAVLHRAWHALPPLTTKQGQVVNAVYGFLLVFFKVLKELAPTHLAVAFDVAGPTFRHKEFAAYKATREKQPDEFYEQIPILKEVLKALKVKVIEAPGYEADDIIGTLSAAAQTAELPNVIVTGDLDTLQLISDQTEVLALRQGLSDTARYNRQAVIERFGLPPEAMLEYRALKGDPSDNIPGVKGIGEKTATLLVKKFGSLEKLYEAVEKSGKPKPPLTERLRTTLREHQHDAFLSRDLSKIRRDTPIAETIDELARQAPDTSSAVKLFQDLEFKSLLAKLNDLDPETATAAAPKISSPAEVSYVLVKSEPLFKKFLTEAESQRQMVIDTETTGLNPFAVELLGISFCWKEGQAYYVPMANHPAWRNKIVALLANKEIAKWGHNLKYDLEVLREAGIEVLGIAGDTMIASYVLNPGSRAHDLDTLAFTEFGHRMIPITALIGEKKPQKSMRDVPLKDLAVYSCEDADYTWRLKNKFTTELDKAGLAGLFQKIEVPMIEVLAAMEKNGVKLDPAILKKTGVAVDRRLKVLEKKIHALAGESFNIASPLQLKHILFDKLKIDSQGIGKTKTGLSTAASELAKLQGKHKIIDPILEYRELAKLKSTYLDALPELIDKKTGRIHTSYNQTITATGRLSSSDPNLQNIPIRTELGNEVRRAFVAESGCTLLSADYSQIELRIVASLANDLAMIDIFRRGEDIHRATAAKIHGLKEDEVTKTIRNTAKEVNFGVLYGMGAWGLASRTGLSQDEARAFIEKYFATFSGVKSYIEETKALAKKLGYVETLFGRRRYLPDINSGMPQVRAAAERMAINMPIQGTAADLMKLAMIEIYRGLNAVSPQAKLILQVHDELVVETPADDIDKVARYIKDAMENIAKLKVPIEVHVSAGKSWGAMKPLPK